MDNFNTQTIGFSDVISYWISLFPEIKSTLEFEDILKTGMSESLQEIEREYYSNNYRLNESLETIFTSYKELDKWDVALDSIIEDPNMHCRWAYFFKPVIKYYLKDLESHLEYSEIFYDKESFLSSIAYYLIEILHVVTFRTLILEINILSEENQLIGDTPKEKADYFSYVVLKDKEYIKSLYTEYVELYRIMNTKAHNTISFIKQLIKHTVDSITNLSDIFNQGQDIGKINNITLNAGDTHNGGKTVSILKFSSGIQLIYKPRNLEIEKKYYDFIEWINDLNIKDFLNLKAAKVYNIGEAGWMEFIENNNCKNTDDAKKYYWRSGEILSILYALNAKDFHYENLIAQGDQPILIDLETLLHPDLYEMDIKDESASIVADRTIMNSVQSIMLLPASIINSKTNKSIDLGGLSVSEEQKSHIRSVFIKDYDSDKVRIHKDFSIITPQKNNPKLDNTLIKSEDFIDEIKNGFLLTYQWILENKEIFINKVVEMFGNIECRVLMKPTADYAQVLITSYHPDLLRNPVDRKIYLHRVALSRNKDLRDIYCAEIQDLLNGDIPFFTTNTNVANIKTCTGNNIKNLYKKATVETILARIRSFNQKDLNRQISIIIMSYLRKKPTYGKEPTGIKFEQSLINKNINPNIWIETAIKLGDYLLDKSIIGMKNGIVERTWIGSIEINKENVQVISSVGKDLYTGNSGIALFLSYLGNITGMKRFKEAAYETMLPVIDFFNNLDDIENIDIGTFNGITGYFYSLYHIGLLYGEEKFIDCVYRNITLLKELTEKANINDVIGGLSGVIGVITTIYEKTEKQEQKEMLLSLANYIFKKLKKHAIVLDNGIGVTWGQEGYVGFSHGNVGISTFLYKLYSITKSQEVFDLVKSSLQYERSMYDNKFRSWKKSLNSDSCSYSWCHGSSGVLMGRVLLKKFGYMDEDIVDEIKIGIESTKENGFGQDYCLCHGDMGNLRILYFTAEVLNNQKLKKQCIYTFDNLIQSFVAKNIESDYFDYKENHELMVGISGLGYGILQFYAPDMLPEILYLG